MTCYAPLQAYRSRIAGAAGGYGITFNKDQSNGQTVQVNCGQCIGCKLDKASQWGIRSIHEAQMWDENSFITLTYDDTHLPWDQSLDKKEYQRFMKRLRKQQQPKTIRFIHSGEYGETCPKHDKKKCEECGPLQRPHYHAILFNHDFPDKYPWKERNGHQTYRSEQLEKLWPLGNSEIGTVTFQSAAYVARYTTKKITGDNALAHYEKINPITGEVIQVKPEYMTTSRGGKDAAGKELKGIGYPWYKKYKDDLFPRDECVIDGRIMKPPQYYTNIYKQQEPEKYEQMKNERTKFFQKHKPDNTWQRLQDREKVKHAQLNQLPRNLEQ